MRVYFFGDSISFGQYVSPHLTWAHRCSSVLHELGERESEDIVVQNPSINGNTTRQALERMAYDVEAHRPDVLLVQFGMNDCNYWETGRGLPRVMPEAFEQSLHEILERGRRCGTSRLLLSTNHPSSRVDPMPAKPGLSYAESNRRYNEIIREVAGKHRYVALNDVERAFAQRMQIENVPVEHLVLEDGVHLSPLGHDWYFEVTGPTVLAAVEGLLARANG